MITSKEICLTCVLDHSKPQCYPHSIKITQQHPMQIWWRKHIPCWTIPNNMWEIFRVWVHLFVSHKHSALIDSSNTSINARDQCNHQKLLSIEVLTSLVMLILILVIIYFICLAHSPYVATTWHQSWRFCSLVSSHDCMFLHIILDKKSYIKIRI